jgi:hypothetical protein
VIAIPAPRSHTESVVLTGDTLEIRHLRVTHPEAVGIARTVLDEHGTDALPDAITTAVVVGLVATRLQHGAGNPAAAMQRVLASFDETIQSRAATTVAQLDEITARLAASEQATRQAAEQALADLPARLNTVLGGEATTVRESVRQAAATVQAEALAQLERVVRTHTEAVRSVISTENPASPIAAMKRDLLGSVDAARREATEGLAALRALNQATQAGQVVSRRNPNVAGADWEAFVADHLAAFAAATGDVVEHVGSTPAPDSSSRKVGDVVLVVGNGGPTIAIECKNRASRALSVREYRAVLSDARQVRRATVGVAVVPSAEHVPGPSRFCRVSGSDFVVAADDPTAFTLVLSVLRELALVAAAGQGAGASVDVGSAQTAGGHALDSLQRWDELARHVSSADKALGNIRTTAENLRGVLTGHLQEASRSLRPGASA